MKKLIAKIVLIFIVLFYVSCDQNVNEELDPKVQDIQGTWVLSDNCLMPPMTFKDLAFNNNDYKTIVKWDEYVTDPVSGETILTEKREESTGVIQISGDILTFIIKKSVFTYNPQVKESREELFNPVLEQNYKYSITNNVLTIYFESGSHVYIKSL